MDKMMTDSRTADADADISALEVPGSDTPEGALWRTILGGDQSAPYMVLTDNASFVHPAGSDGLTRPELNKRNFNAVNAQVGRWAVESLGHEDPESRRLAVEALNAIISYEELELARHWVIYQGGVFGFLCAFSPGERVRKMAHRYAGSVRAIEIELGCT